VTFVMAPFRWPQMKQDLALAKEVASKKTTKPADWDEIANSLGKAFSAEGKTVEMKGRGCRERMERLQEKHKNEDKKALKRSGTEEDCNELTGLLDDILTYRRDMEELKKEKEVKKKKEIEDKKKGEEMRNAAMVGLAKRRHDSSNDSTDEDDDGDDEDDDGDDDSSFWKRKEKSSFFEGEIVEEAYSWDLVIFDNVFVGTDFNYSYSASSNSPMRL
ncbi:hypothetical protein QZH41_016892, partial [Actinostola sp. cb2023]